MITASPKDRMVRGSEHTRGDAFTLHPDREAAFWRLAEAVGLNCDTASAATLVKEAVERGRLLAGHETGFGAASELAFHLRQGPIQFLARPGPGQRRTHPAHEGVVVDEPQADSDEAREAQKA